MKKIRIALIAALCMIVVGLCILLAYGLAGGNLYRHSNHNNYSDVQKVLEKEISLDGIDSISVLYGMNHHDIYIYESQSDTVLIKEYGYSEVTERELSTITVNDNSLEIKGARWNRNNMEFGLFYFNNEYNCPHYMEIFLPASYHGELLLETSSGDIYSDIDIVSEQDVSISSTSGDISFPSITAKNADVTSTSGNVTIETIETDADGSTGIIHISTTSGDVHITELTGKTESESTSGNLTIETIKGNTLLRTTSGDIRLTEITGTIDAESNSGNVAADILSGDTQIRTTSGDVSVNRLDGNLQLSTTSGCVKILGGEGERAVSTASGDITIKGDGGSFQTDTQSGDVLISFRNASGNIKTTSGEIRLELGELTGDLNINSNSGNAVIHLSEENAFEFNAETTSGVIRTFFDNNLNISSDRDYAHGMYGTNVSGYLVQIKTISGDVTVDNKIKK